MIDLGKLIAISRPPAEAKKWLPAAEEGVDYLLSQCGGDETIIYAALQCTLVHGVLARHERVTPPDHSDLLNAMIMQDATWAIGYATGGGKPDRVHLAPPLDRSASKSLVDGETLITRRRFESVDKGKTRTEVSQKLVHALGLYWRDEESAYCRLDENGDIEPVLKVIDLERQISTSGLLVTIRAHDLARYLVVTNTVLVTKFDFTRVLDGSFTGWAESGQYKARGSDLFYTTTTQPDASYANGVLISRSKLTHDDLVYEHRSNWRDSDKKYATFKAYDWKNGRLAEISCAPTALASYFEPESPLPYQITPAFFRPEVLQRYKADPEKYSMEHRSISSRAGWSLKTFDVNEQGQVHTYLRYLGSLPYQEQLYWQSFNEWPKGTISKRAFQTDIEGKWTDIPDPLVELISEVRALDEVAPDWWSARGDDLRATMHYPITTSPEEWANSILTLDQLLVEGFSTRAIRLRLQALGRPYEEQWGSLKLLQELFATQGQSASEAAAALKPLRELHHLRSKVKGHAAHAQRQALVKEARTEHGSLKEHFLQLTTGCRVAFSQACECLSKATSTSSS